jgi:hypothetical protein
MHRDEGGEEQPSPTTARKAARVVCKTFLWIVPLHAIYFTPYHAGPCSIRCARAYVRIMRTDMRAHAYVKFVNIHVVMCIHIYVYVYKYIVT